MRQPDFLTATEKPFHRIGMISAVMNFIRQISGAFGAAFFGLFMTSTNEDESYGNVGTALVAVAVTFLIAIWYFARVKQPAVGG
ncbi:hypothetical protein BSU04_35295 [Caballeronia sordidicola]|uniref:Uncharacterized protein n=1 Tax=Caballeronia sordidicola TaxID=196367 RepID=A0A226WSG4_CABSO|nr:hypothetical protein BSU04_35295 [Caballeronia sordidicola]